MCCERGKRRAPRFPSGSIGAVLGLAAVATPWIMGVVLLDVSLVEEMQAEAVGAKQRRWCGWAP